VPVAAALTVVSENIMVDLLLQRPFALEVRHAQLMGRARPLDAGIRTRPPRP